MELNLVMLGPPGAGKGTQARQLRRKWNIPHVSTGAMLREAVQAGTPLGREVAAIMESGGLIDDEVITRVVTERLAQPDTKAGFLLDGFPRTIPQAEALDRIVAGRAPLIIIEIVLSEAEVVRRLASRMVCAECGTNATGEGEAWATLAVEEFDGPAGFLAAEDADETLGEMAFADVLLDDLFLALCRVAKALAFSTREADFFWMKGRKSLRGMRRE